MFTDKLKDVVDNVDGGKGALVMGLDGIAVDSYTRPGEKFDLDAMGMEFSFILGQVKKAGESLDVGGLQEFSVRADEMTMICRMLSKEYFWAVVLDNRGNYGKCRYLMRVTQPKLAAQL